MKNLGLVILIATHSLVFSIPVPEPQTTPGQAGANAANNLPLSWLVNALPRSGIVGMADNLGAGLANFGNSQGSAFDAILSGIFNAFGNFISGILGSGAVNTAFLNFNNRPPPDTGATPAPAGGAAAGGGATPGAPAEPEEPAE